MSVLKIENASFSYGKHKIFEGVSLEANKGEVFCIVGPNGCGKSTLLDCILGLNKLDSGNIKVAGKDIKEYKSRELAAEIAYVPQDHKAAFPYSVLDVVAMGRSYEYGMFGGSGKDAYGPALEALEKIGMADLKDRDYTTLSGGELQLVLIARGICQNAGILVMDEPTSHLDFRHELQIMEVTASLAKDNGITVIMATHFLNQAFYLESAGVNTTVALMENKSFGAVGLPGSVLDEENLRKVFRIRTEVSENSRGRKFILPIRNIGDDE